MKRIDFLQTFSELFEFKTILDENLVEYVVLSSSKLNSIENIQDKTAFEAVENHVHLLDNIKKSEIDALERIAPIIGKAVLNSLKACYPCKNFLVYVTFCLNDSLIIRFHQIWENEPPYYTIEDFEESEDRVYCFGK